MFFILIGRISYIMNKVNETEGIFESSDKQVKPPPYIVQISVCSRISGSVNIGKTNVLRIIT